MGVLDKLSKFAHFIRVKSTFKAVNIAEIFLREIFRLHGNSKGIISYRDSKFIGNIWSTLFEGLDTQLIFITVYHTQTNGHKKCVNQILEDMLRMYVSIILQNGRITCTWYNLHIKMVTMPLIKCHPLKFYMEENE